MHSWTPARAQQPPPHMYMTLGVFPDATPAADKAGKDSIPIQFAGCNRCMQCSARPDLSIEFVTNEVQVIRASMNTIIDLAFPGHRGTAAVNHAAAYLVAGDGLLVLPILPEHVPQAPPGWGIAAVDAQGLAVALLGCLAPPLALGPPQISQVVVHIHLRMQEEWSSCC